MYIAKLLSNLFPKFLWNINKLIIKNINIRVRGGWGGGGGYIYKRGPCLFAPNPILLGLNPDERFKL